MKIRTSSTCCWLAAAVLPLPAGGDDRLGVMTHFAQGWDPACIPAIARAGIPQVRDELYWARVEPQPGVFAFPAEYDRYMSVLAQQRISPLIVLSFENPHYDGGDTPHSDEAVAAYARYAVEVLRRYGSQIKAVEVWNEFNGSFARGRVTENRADAYLRLLRATHAAIRRERPDVLVVAGATSGLPLPYWEKLLAGGVLDCADALSVHPYRFDAPPEGLEAELGALQALVKKTGGGQPKPIWVTELGWLPKTSAAPGDPAIDPETQARFLVRAIALLLSTGVERIYWYALRDAPGINMGLFDDDANLTPRPAGVALTTLIRQLQDAHFVRREETAANFYSLVFARPTGGEIRVVWSLAPADVDATGVTSVVDFRGQAVTPDQELRIDEAPLFLTGTPRGLPPAAAPPAVLADSNRDFAPTQGMNGWAYGTFGPGTTTLTPLSEFVTTDWTKAWTGVFPAVAVSAGDQHPSVAGGGPIAAVRRWESSSDGRVRVAGRFRCQTSGDGVGVSILVDGQSRFRKLLGGGGGNPIVEAFDFIATVRAGTRLDFAVDPGPAADPNYDATAVAVTISRETP